MENKAPGTEPRQGGYDASGGGTKHENFFQPRTKVKGNIQRASLRSGQRMTIIFTSILALVVMVPSYLGPAYVEYMSGQEWLQRATKSIWTRRNEKQFEMYMTQRKNSWFEYLGLKQYNISGDENTGDIQTYRQE